MSEWSDLCPGVYGPQFIKYGEDESWLKGPELISTELLWVLMFTFQFHVGKCEIGMQTFYFNGRSFQREFVVAIIGADFRYANGFLIHVFCYFFVFVWRYCAFHLLVAACFCAQGAVTTHDCCPQNQYFSCSTSYCTKKDLSVVGSGAEMFSLQRTDWDCTSGSYRRLGSGHFSASSCLCSLLFLNFDSLECLCITSNLEKPFKM